MNVRLTPELDEKQLQGLYKSLLNSWIHEYFLRDRPKNHDETYLRQSLTWSYREAYLSAMFSGRAVLLAFSGNTIYNESALCEAMCKMAKSLYGPDYTEKANPYLDLNQYRANLEFIPPTEPGAMEQLESLTKKAIVIATIHERYICESIGKDRYTRLLESTPDYILRSFVAERTLFVSLSTVSEIEL